MKDDHVVNFKLANKLRKAGWTLPTANWRCCDELDMSDLTYCPTVSELLDELPKFMPGGFILSMSYSPTHKWHVYYYAFGRDAYYGSKKMQDISEKEFVDALAKMWMQLTKEKLI